MDVIIQQIGSPASASLHWSENVDGAGTFFQHPLIYSSPDRYEPADIDLDGDLDLVISDVVQGEMTLLLLEKLEEGFAPPSVIATGIDFGPFICSDINNDQLPEIIYQGEGSLNWLINTGEDFSNTGSYTHNASNGHIFMVGDIDGDADNDIVLGHYDAYALINAGDGTSWSTQLIANGIDALNHNRLLIDVEGDGDLDIVDVWDRVGWFENPTAQTGFDIFEHHHLEYNGVYATGHVGIIGCNEQVTLLWTSWPFSASNIFLRWNAYDPATEEFSSTQQLDSLFSRCTRLADINGDGYQDLVIFRDDTVSWHAYEPDHLLSLIELELPFNSVALSDPPLLLTGGLPEGGIYTIAASGEPMSEFDPAAFGAGSHTIVYTYDDPFTGCTASDTSIVTVDVSTSIIGYNRWIFQMSPNPTSGLFLIRMENVSDHGTVQVHDVLGREVVTDQVKSASHQLDLSDQPKGFYLVTLQTDRGISTQRLVLE